MKEISVEIVIKREGTYREAGSPTKRSKHGS